MPILQAFFGALALHAAFVSVPFDAGAPPARDVATGTASSFEVMQMPMLQTSMERLRKRSARMDAQLLDQMPLGLRSRFAPRWSPERCQRDQKSMGVVRGWHGPVGQAWPNESGFFLNSLGFSGGSWHVKEKIGTGYLDEQHLPS